MTLKAPNINILWAKLMIEELRRCGADRFCLAPGSRNSPLVAAVAEHPAIEPVIHYDERGLAYFALGCIAARRKPAVIISTSGTAVANFMPAVVEASKKKLPLIVLTADRPPELRQTGAMQTIEQPGIFHPYVRWQFDMPCPDTNMPPEFVLTTIDQAVYRARTDLSGPVHLNCMYREPLAPLRDNIRLTGYVRSLNTWLKKTEPFTHYADAIHGVPAGDTNQVIALINSSLRGMIVVGKLHSVRQRRAVLALAEKTGWPICPDITSGLRLGRANEGIWPYYDLMLSLASVRKTLAPEIVLHIGGRLTSKRWYAFIKANRPRHYIMVLNHPLRHDPQHMVTHRLYGAIENVVPQITRHVKNRPVPVSMRRLSGMTGAINRYLDEWIRRQNTLNEITVARLITQLQKNNSALFLGNSLPIREVDSFGAAGGPPVDIGANRGASGIDGVLASACGFARGLNKPVTLLIGDLSLLHDLNSLGLVRASRRPMVIVVLNNDGGGIFSFLPIGQFDKIFEQHFATPHGYSFDQVAGMFGLDYYHPTTPESFIRQYRKAIGSPRSSLIEVKTKRPDNVKTQAHVLTGIRKLLEKGR